MDVREYGKILVTGGAGFIGSHLVDALMEKGCKVVCFDNLSTGKLENIKKWLNHPKFTFVKGDLLDREAVRKVADCDAVFHLAANPEVRIAATHPSVHFEQNIVATFNLLEELRLAGKVKLFVFTSSSTVYGDAEVMPTPETYAPLIPISTYGAAKLACEALIASYAKMYGFKAVILRIANVVGPRMTHGVILDFIAKLRRNPRELEILGDGTQCKSYLHVKDCVNAILIAAEKSEEQVSIYNVGSEDRVSVKEIADIVAEEMGLKNVKYRFTGGIEGRGWVGDVKYMLLDVRRLKKLGWRPSMNSSEAIRSAVRSVLLH